MQQLFSGLETFKTELLLRQQNVTANLLGTVASLQGDVRTLTSKVDSMQMKLSRVDESVANLTNSVEDIDIEIIDSTEPPLTTQTTSFYNYTAPPPLSGKSLVYIIMILVSMFTEYLVRIQNCSSELV